MKSECSERRLPAPAYRQAGLAGSNPRCHPELNSGYSFVILRQPVYRLFLVFTKIFIYAMLIKAKNHQFCREEKENIMPGIRGAKKAREEEKNTALIAKIMEEYGQDPELKRIADAIPRIRPRKRGECEGQERPCPFVGCQHHLFLNVTAGGIIKFNFPGQEVWELKETCSLDIADKGGVTLEEVGESLCVTRERIRQLEEKSEKKLRGDRGNVLKEFIRD